MEYKLETLELYVIAEGFSNDVWFVVEKWTHFQKDTIGKQLVRSADSISANIAEGYGRHFYAESKQFYYYSRGSITETQSWLKKAKVRGLTTESECEKLMTKLETIHIKLNAYISWLKKSNSKTNTPKTNNPLSQ
ncbi:MAG: four helix bundle protein [Bacteroidota bacterium]|nr:four helix bundle protein [Bacteroidota bacterium]